MLYFEHFIKIKVKYCSTLTSPKPYFFLDANIAHVVHNRLMIYSKTLSPQLKNRKNTCNATTKLLLIRNFILSNATPCLNK